MLQIHFQNMERWQNRVALVTGASMGVGEAIVRTLVKQGMKVVGCARSEDKLKVSVPSHLKCRFLHFGQICPAKTTDVLIEIGYQKSQR